MGIKTNPEKDLHSQVHRPAHEVLQAINRHLERSGKQYRIFKTRPHSTQRTNLGEYYRGSISGNRVIEPHFDLDAEAIELGQIGPYQTCYSHKVEEKVRSLRRHRADMQKAKTDRQRQREVRMRAEVLRELERLNGLQNN